MTVSKNVVKVNCSSLDELIRNYISIWNGNLKLSETEINVYVEIVKKYVDLINTGITDNDYINTILFSKENRKGMRQNLNMSESYLNVALNRLKNKKVLTEDNKLDNRFIPSNIEFKFILNDNNRGS